MILLLADLALAQSGAPHPPSEPLVQPLVQPSPQALSLGLTLPWLSQPGLILGLRRDLGATRWQGGLDLAGWVNPKDSFHGQLTPQFGAEWQRLGDDGTLRIASTVGVGLGLESRTTERSLNLADGSSEGVWEQQLWAVPQLSTRLSWRHSRQFPVFLDLSVGQQLAWESNGGTVFTVTFGVLLSGKENP